jgi:chemotaxis protein histidine kinase CheA
MSSALPAVRAERCCESLDPSKRAGQNRLREELGKEQDEAEWGRLSDEADGQLTETKDQLDEALRQVKATQAELQQARAEAAAQRVVVETQRAEAKATQTELQQARAEVEALGLKVEALGLKVETQRAEAKAAQAKAEVQRVKMEKKAKAKLKKVLGQLTDAQEQLKVAHAHLQSFSLRRLEIDQSHNTVKIFDKDVAPGDASPPTNDPNSSRASPYNPRGTEGAPEPIDKPILPLLGSQHSRPADQRQLPGIVHYSIGSTSMGEILKCLRDLESIPEIPNMPSKSQKTFADALKGIKSGLQKGPTGVRSSIRPERQLPGIVHYSIGSTSMGGILKCLRDLESIPEITDMPSKSQETFANALKGIKSGLQKGTTGVRSSIRPGNPLYPPIPLAPNKASKPTCQQSLADAENCPPQPPPSRRSKRRHKTSN